MERPVQPEDAIVKLELMDVRRFDSGVVQCDTGFVPAWSV